MLFACNPKGNNKIMFGEVETIKDFISLLGSQSKEVKKNGKLVLRNLSSVGMYSLPTLQLSSFCNHAFLLLVVVVLNR